MKKLYTLVTLFVIGMTGIAQNDTIISGTIRKDGDLSHSFVGYVKYGKIYLKISPAISNKEIPKITCLSTYGKYLQLVEENGESIFLLEYLSTIEGVSGYTPKLIMQMFLYSLRQVTKWEIKEEVRETKEAEEDLLLKVILPAE